MPPQHQVIHGGHVRKELDILEGAGNPDPGHPVRFQGSNVLIFEKYLSPAGFVDAADTVEDGGLSRLRWAR